jgi:hypothetical protein
VVADVVNHFLSAMPKCSFAEAAAHPDPTAAAM